MAFWDKKKRDPSQIHGGLEYKQNDNISIDQINAVVNNSFYATDRSDYAVDLSTALADPPDNTDVNKVGTPKVELIDNEKNGKVLKKFKFSNLKGEKGDKGDTGNDGASVWVRYSANADGTGMTETPEEGTRYVGFFQGDAPSGDIANYTWSLYRGKGFSNVTIEGSSFKISYDDGTKEIVPIDTTNCLATEGVSIEENLVHPATLIPNGTDIDTYTGSEYWGRCFYAGGSNTVTGVPEGREGNAFNLEVVRGGGQRTIQVYRDASIEYVRSADGTTWQEWTRLAQSDGYYSEMGVGEAGRLSAHLVGNYGAGRHFGKWAHIGAKSNFRSSVVFLVNGSNNPVEEGSGLLEVEFVNRTTGIDEVAVNVLSGDLMPELFLVAPNADGVDVYVHIREYRTSYISLVSLTPHSTISWMNEDTGATAPADAVYATRTNNASGAEYLSRYAFLSAGSSQMGWWKLGSLNLDEMPNDSNRSCLLLVNGVYANQSLSGAAESGLLEFDVRKGSISAAGLSILNGNLNAEEFCVILSQTEATVYIKLPSQYNSFAVTMLSEDSASASKASPLFEFNTQFIGTSAPSGAVYAVVRNVASRAEALALKNIFSGTLSYGYSVTLPIAVDFKNDEAIFDVYFQINGDSGYKGSVTTKNACMITEEATGETVIVVRAMVCPSEGFNAVVRNIDIRLVYNSSSRELTYDTFSVWSVGASGQISTANTNTIVNITGIRIKKAAL